MTLVFSDEDQARMMLGMSPVANNSPSFAELRKREREKIAYENRIAQLEADLINEKNIAEAYYQTLKLITRENPDLYAKGQLSAWTGAYYKRLSNNEIEIEPESI